MQLAPQQLADRQPQRLALQVPQGHIERAHAKGRNPFRAVPPDMGQHLVPGALHIASVLADQQRRQPLLDNQLRRQRGLAKLRNTLAPTDRAVIGLDPRQGDVAFNALVMGFRIGERICLNSTDLHSCFSLLTPLYSLLAVGRSGLFGPPLCGGSAPATPPLLKPPPQRVCGNMTLATRCDRASPPPRLGRFRVCASADKTGEATPIYAQRSPR